MRGYKHSRLDGSTNRVMREVRINLFNKPQSPQFIFCLSTRYDSVMGVYRQRGVTVVPVINTSLSALNCVIMMCDDRYVAVTSFCV
jgi:hypothetical protein